jgi:hypothetical protein
MKNWKFTLGQMMIAIAAVGMLPWIYLFAATLTPILPICISILINAILGFAIYRLSGVSSGAVSQPPRPEGRWYAQPLRFTRRQMMIATATVCVPLVFFKNREYLHYSAGYSLLDIPYSLIICSCILNEILLVICLIGLLLYCLTSAPLWLRLSIEVAALLAVLALSAWVWRPRFDDWQAGRADEMAWLISEWAEEVDGPRERETLRREAAWFARRALVLRWTAIWYGLVREPYDPHPARYDDRKLVHELGVLGAMERHEERARREYERTRGGP